MDSKTREEPELVASAPVAPTDTAETQGAHPGAVENAHSSSSSSRPGSSGSRDHHEAETPLTGPPTIDYSNTDKDATDGVDATSSAHVAHPTPMRPSTLDQAASDAIASASTVAPSEKREDGDAALAAEPATQSGSETPAKRLSKSVASTSSRLRSMSLGAKSAKPVQEVAPMMFFEDEPARNSKPAEAGQTEEDGLEDFQPPPVRRRTTFGGHRSTLSGDKRRSTISLFMNSRSDAVDEELSVPPLPVSVPLPEAPTAGQVESLRRRNTLKQEDPAYRPTGIPPKAAAGAYSRSISLGNVPLRPLSIESSSSLILNPPSLQTNSSLVASIAEEHESSSPTTGAQTTASASEPNLAASARSRSAFNRLSKIDSVASMVNDARSRSRSASGKAKGLSSRSLRAQGGNELASGKGQARDTEASKTSRISKRMQSLRSRGGCSIM